MYPIHRYMEPYGQTFPYQREPNTCPQYFPSWEVMPPQMKADLSTHPSACVPSPLNGSNGYLRPADHGGCCHQSYPLCYSFRPPHPHLHAPPQPYYYGSCPYPDVYTSYFVPPPHYSVNQAQYDYDKNRNHCCSCPNHTCHQREKSSPKIEEQKPKKEDKDYPGLIQSDYPYPVVWIPPGYMKAKGNDKSSELQPGQCNGWIPFDLNSLKGLRQDAEDKRGELQFPVIWMPGYGKPEEAAKDKKELNATPNTVEEWPSKLKIVPLKFLENENRGEKPAVIEEEHKNEIKPEAEVEKESRIKTIPVKHLEEKNDKKQEAKFDERKYIISEKQKEESEVKKVSDSGESSPVRSSKLPPVCLRVDPLPKRRSANGKSRSPSPPGLKEEKVHQHKEEQRSMRDNREEDSRRKEIPVIAVKENLSSHAGKEHECQDEVSVASLKDSSEKTGMGKADKIEDGKEREATCKVVEVLEGGREEVKKDEGGNSVEGQERKVEVLETEKMDEKKERARNFSESDAAVIIQSAYRGFEVRRWQSLEKLRKIAQIREQASNIRMQIQNFEAASREQQLKQKVVIGETIMKLLLQLDTIQGLHPSIREVRKSVARELTCLQEKLDMLGSEITKEEKPVEVEKKTSDESSENGSACIISSCPEANLSCKQALSEEKGESMDRSATKEPEIVEDNLTNAPADEEVAFVASPTEHVTEQEPVQLANEKSPVEQPSFENEENEDSDSCSADVACPSPAEDAIPGRETEPASAQPTDGSNIAVQPVMENEESGTELESYEDGAAAGQTEEAKDLSEPSLGSEVSELTSQNQCENEEEFNASVSSDEKQLSCRDTVPSLDAKEFEESSPGVGEDTDVNEKIQRPMEGGDSGRGALVHLASAGEDSAEVCGVVVGEDNSQSKVTVSMEEQREVIDGVQEDFHGLPSAEGSCYIELSPGTETLMANDDVKEAVTENPEMAAMGSNVGAIEEVAGPNEPAALGTEGVYMNGVHSTVGSNHEDLSPECLRATTEEVEPQAPKDESSMISSEERKLVEENEKLKEMLEKLLEAGKEQLGVISNLNGRVKDLERKLAQKKKGESQRTEAGQMRCSENCMLICLLYMVG